MEKKGDDIPDVGLTRCGESNNSLLLGEEFSMSPDKEMKPAGDANATTDSKPAKKDEPTSPASEEVGRPPRGPSGGSPSKPRPPKPPVVARNTSIGETSAVSALTDDENNNVNLSFRHEKTVSWDADQYSELSLPILGDAAVDVPEVSSKRSAEAMPKTPPAERAKRNWAKVRATIQANDLSIKQVNPLETEAEAAIFRVVEKARRANAAKPTNILRHVSVEAAEVFGEQDSSAAKNKNAGDEAKGHKRTNTLDNALFDLAKQMDTIHMNGQDSSGGRQRKGSADTGGGRERKGTADYGEGRPRFFSADSALPEAKGNSGDVLAQNAAALFRRPIAKRMESSRVVSPSSEHVSDNSTLRSIAGRRNSLKTSGSSAIADAKKTDVEEAVEAMVDVDIEAGVEVEGEGDSSRENQKFNLGRGARRLAQAANTEMKEDFDSFWQFLRPRRGHIKTYLGVAIGCLIFPLVLAAAMLYYIPRAREEKPPDLGREGATWSWFLLFLARNVVTGGVAKCSEVLVIDLFTLHFRLTSQLFGTIFALLLVQSKGWPFIVFAWGVANFAMNSGNNPFAHHWLFWQDAIELFNEKNLSGTITYSRTNYVVNGIAVAVGVAVAVKRLWWGLYLGKRSYRHYGDELARVMKDMVIISKVAAWARDIEKYGKNVLKKKFHKASVAHEPLDSIQIVDYMSVESNEDVVTDEIDTSSGHTEGGAEADGRIIDDEEYNKLTGSITPSQRTRINELLGRWEEPEVLGEGAEEVSIASILQFRQMLAYMDQDFPFSLAYGPADSRVACIESAQSVYLRLMELTPDKALLPFDTLAVIAKDKDGDIDTEEMKELIRLFRPERNGDLSCLDFVKCCDQVYKNMRLLRASIVNSGQIDHAFEIMVNIVFYLIVVIIILAALDLDPLALFVSISGIVLAFAFMISSASSRFFEGILLILVRRPFDIGDRIAVSNPEDNLSTDGSPTWFVQKVDLFTTTVRFAATNEVATIANSSLASSRVINAKRSPQANVYVYMKFSVDVPYTKVLVFRKAVEAFVKERPREFIAVNGFRATRVEPDHGYIEYIIVLGHRSSWQDVGVILQSKADVASYCLELAKKLNMRYTAPPLPVNLSMASQSNLQLLDQNLERGPPEGFTLSPAASATTPSSPDIRSIDALFKKE